MKQPRQAGGCKLRLQLLLWSLLWEDTEAVAKPFVYGLPVLLYPWAPKYLRPESCQNPVVWHSSLSLWLGGRNYEDWQSWFKNNFIRRFLFWESIDYRCTCIWNEKKSSIKAAVKYWKELFLENVIILRTYLWVQLFPPENIYFDMGFFS